MNHKEALLNHYTTFDGFYSQYFSQHKNLANGEWQVSCPFHDDKTPSMSVNPRTGMFFCHGCSAEGDFIKFYMMKHGKDFISAVKEMCSNAGISDIQKTEPIKKKTEKIKYKLIKEYDYLDKNGKLVSQTLRYEPKKFSQRTKANGEWIWSLKSVETVLYNLQNVINAERVLVMEGEKDCDLANRLGYVATTCPMGAGKWKDSYDEFLADKELVLFPDNDPVGIKHMISVGERLKDKSIVKWFEYPEKNKKGFDFTDFIKTFKTKTDAIENTMTLIRASRVFDPKKIIIPIPDTEESEKIKSWIKASPGEFSTRDLDYDLGFNDPQQKQSRTQILEKFVSEKILSREGKRRGQYRPYKKELELIDFMNAKDNYVPLWLPMNIHEMVGIMPGNIIVLSGEANAGKTAMMLNIIKYNMDRFNVHYFNSEMGAGELKGRLLKFEDLSLDQWNFNSYSRDSDFEDVVFTGENSLNIIDFLEVHDDFYLVGEKIKKIHLALKGAIAIIAIQKNKGAEFGVGGNRTMEKARLVINVEPGKFKITKAKNFIDPNLNPNGLMCDWKLVNGCKFMGRGMDWYKN